jgi:galactokinase
MTRAFWAPGRVNLIGEHTDYTGGLVLPAALELGLRLECAPAAGAIRLRSGEFEGEVELDATGAGDGVTGWGRYVAAVAAELDALGRSPVGLVGTIESSLPAGAGLASSAALEVVVATALCAVAELSLEPVELALTAQRAEHRAVGVPCGIMDQCVSVLGEEGHAILLDTASLEHRAIPLPPELDLLVVDSGVRHRLEDSGYAARRRELEQALVVLEGRSPAAVAPGEAEELAQAARLEPALARRLRHVVSENARVREVVAALTTEPRDLIRVGELFRDGHESLRRDFEVSIPELDLLVDLSYRAGAVAARMTGGGFGGSIVALVKTENALRVAEDVVAAYDESAGGPLASVRISRAARGAYEL